MILKSGWKAGFKVSLPLGQIEVGLFGRGGSLHSVSLDLLTHHATSKCLMSAHKAQVVVATFVLARVKSQESIEIQLSHKGSKFGLLEESWHEKLDKVIWLVNGETSSMGPPRDDIFQTFSFSSCQTFMKLPGEGIGGTSLRKDALVLFLWTASAARLGGGRKHSGVCVAKILVWCDHVVVGTAAFLVNLCGRVLDSLVVDIMSFARLVSIGERN
mmetsp:Transcript_5724/g.11921  ORF Transcript_5724/g.11921 Transcript_5724/m.11921 type:complete len:215 (-) Transcript_5724:2-646(-)